MEETIEILYIFGAHENEVDMKRAKQEGVCALCDNPIFLYGRGVLVDSDSLPIENWKTVKKKYIATSCFMNLNRLFGGIQLERNQS